MIATTAPPKGCARSSAEIVERIQSFTAEDDFGGHRARTLSYALDYEAAYPVYLSGRGVHRPEWDMVRITDVYRETFGTFLVLLGAVLYHERLTIQLYRLQEYVWLLGRDDVLAEMQRMEFTPFGVGELYAAAMHLGDQFLDAWTERAGQDERLARMAAGLPCTPGGCEGCSQ